MHPSIGTSSRLMLGQMSSLEDIKSSADNALKQLSLDHLGNIAAHLRGITLRAKASDEPLAKKLRPLDEVRISLNTRKNCH